MSNIKSLLKKHKKLSIFTGVFLGLIILSVGGFLLYASDYYRADKTALSILEENYNLEVRDNLTVLSPSEPTDTAIVFYPGAKVQAEAYLPLLDAIRDMGIKCILVEMPFNVAIFGSNEAKAVMEEFDEIENWYIMGHSMGGAMASKFASENK